jgi:hypothetical protein
MATIPITYPTTNLKELPGGAALHLQISNTHPSRRSVRKILALVERKCANGEHATNLVRAVVNDSSLVTPDVQSKLESLLRGGCVSDVVVPRPPYSWLGGCLARQA